LPVPVAPELTVSHDALLAAVHVHAAVVPTVSDAEMGDSVNVAEVGVTLYVHPACVTVTVCPATVSVAVREALVVLPATV
jgi:hypothetical protein